MRDLIDRAPRRVNAAMAAEVQAGLSRRPKQLSPKYFYDDRGSRLFEEITRLPEYYLTRTERGLLSRWMPLLVPRLGITTLVELGAGSAEKSRIILDAIQSTGALGTYVPIDVSASFLAETARRLVAEYPGLQVIPTVADIEQRLRLPHLPPGPALYAFLGSTIGNFESAAAIDLVTRVRRSMREADLFLMGADLRKDPAIIEPAYNDSQGVTAEFNLNVLRVLNRELGADFELDGFEHRAFYDTARNRIEMHLVSTREQTVRIPGVGAFAFAQGESMRTEISCKYDRPSVEALFDAAGLRLETWLTDPQERFALVLGSPQ